MWFNKMCSFHVVEIFPGFGSGACGGEASAFAGAVERVCAAAEDDWLALDLALMAAKLKQLGLAERDAVRVVKRMAYGVHQVEMAWPLGMAYFGLS